MAEDRNTNAGVHALNGFALQRNTALYILLSDYHSIFKNKNYFVCLEHHDDFLFCFLDEGGNCEKIDVYQSKKASSDWTINKELRSIIVKLLETGKQLIIDQSLTKAPSYQHKLHFSSNRPIKLKHKINKNNTISQSIDESNCLVSFNELPNEIKGEITTKLPIDSDHQLELDKLHFLYVDLPKTDATQQEQLIGKINCLFGKQITDSKAAIETIIHLFKKIETVFNQRNKVKLLDPCKQVTSQQIDEAINLITTKAKAFDYWRSQERSIRNTLKIKFIDGDTFQYTFETAFDLFKAIENQEHRDIFNFVKSNYSNSVKLHPEDIVLELHELFLKKNDTQFDEIKLKAIIYAAYFEATAQRE